MPANINSHVVRLHRFLPFSAAHDQIYEEYQTGEDRLDLETVSIDYAASAIRAGARCLVLTGDAGHGKTHMCRRLLEHALLGHAPEAARHHLLESCNASVSIAPAEGVVAPNLRIHKDLSEIQPPSRAAKLLEESAAREGECLVVCANEGRLRAIVNSDGAGQVCAEIRQLFEESFRRGITADTEGLTHIINLNYQSVAAGAVHRQGSLIRRVLASWVGDGRRWPDRSCGTCDHRSGCPIRRNRVLLAEEHSASETRLHRLEAVFEVVERLGYVVTIREMLMLVAYMLTGGLTCGDVDRRMSGASAGWQHPWIFYNLIFRSPPNLPDDRAEKVIPVLAALRRLDPGLIAVRRVDERILSMGQVFEPGQTDLQFSVQIAGNRSIVDAAFGIDDFNGNPQTRADQLRETDATNLAVAALRRRAFFDDADARESVMQRLGFRFGDMFALLIAGRMSVPDRVKAKNTIVAGLHAIQSLRTGRNETMLHLVDPAFGKASADAAIIARRIPVDRIHLMSASSAWLGGQDAGWFIPKAVDWIDRAVVLRIDEGLGRLRELPLDLLSFECITRAASGHVSEEFYANEIRQVRTFLGQLAEGGASDDAAQIMIFMRGQIQNVSLDMGVIQVGGE